MRWGGLARPQPAPWPACRRGGNESSGRERGQGGPRRRGGLPHVFLVLWFIAAAALAQRGGFQRMQQPDDPYEQVADRREAEFHFIRSEERRVGKESRS